MGFSCFLLLLTILIASKPISSAKGDSDLIQQTCKNTKYYDLCVSSLKSDSTSRKADTKGLAVIMVKAGIANATATTTYLSSQMQNDTVLKKVVKECGDKYAFARDALNATLDDLTAEIYDYAYMHVMAAADYPNACRNAFRRNPGLGYPPELAVREEGFRRICDVVLGIIDALGF